MSYHRPLLSGELIGREQELQELQVTLQLASTGQSRLVVLAGEAGLGKTKLYRTFVKENQDKLGIVLFGQAIPQDAALPFGPFLDAFRRYSLTRTMGPLASPSDSLYAPMAFLAQIFPELASLVSGAAASPSVSDNTGVQGQQSVFYGILNVLQLLARTQQRPLLLVLEDLHWADETSLDLLAFLAQRLGVNTAQPEVSTPLLIMATYRSEALPERLALNRLLTQLQSQRHLHEIRLAPLTFAEQWRCANAILGQGLPEPFARFLFDWDEGNPFFLEELLSALAASGQLQEVSRDWLVPSDMKLPLPSSLAAAILERFEQLSPTGQEVLAYASVIGRTFSFPFLAALCAIDEPELIDVLRQAVRLQLIGEVGASASASADALYKEQEHYQFRHALSREAIYNSMLLSERRLRHRTIAETLEQLTGGQQEESDTVEGSNNSSRDVTIPVPVDQVHQLLAEHYWLAGLPDKAYPHALQEAERARRIFALREERYYLHMAQSSLPEYSPQRLALVLRMGMVSLGMFEFSDALYWLGIAKAGYQQIGQSYQALQTMAQMLLPSWFVASSSLPAMLAELEAATEVVFADPQHANRDYTTLFITSLIAIYQAYDCQFKRAMHWIERSLELYASLAEPQRDAALQLSLLARGWVKAHQYASVAEEGIAELHNVLKTALENNLPDVIVFCYAWLSFTLLFWGRGDEAKRVLAKSREFEQLSGLPHPSFVEGWKDFFSGEQWEQGIASLQEDIQRREQANVPTLVAIETLPLVQMLLARNELEKAEAHLRHIQPVLERQDQYIYLSQMWWGYVKFSQARGDLLQAQELYERILSRWKTTQDTFIILPIFLDGILFHIDAANLAQARQWLNELRALVQRTDNPVGAAGLLHVQGALKAAEGNMEEAISLLREAENAWSSLRWRYLQALAAQRLAEVLLAWAGKHSSNRATKQGARAEADAFLAQALAVYERLQVPTGIQAVHSLGTRARLEAQQKRRSTLQSRQPLQNLTERERQVLRLLAAGQTNREIARTLNLSVGTVELHVSRILSKLHCKTRTQAAAYALGHDLDNDRVTR